MLKIFKLQFGKSRIFFLFCLSLVAGVALGPLLNYYLMAALAMIFIVTASLFWADKRFVVVGLMGLMLLLGAWRFQTSFPYEEENFIGKYYGQKVEIEGVVIKDPDVRSDKVNLTIKPTSLPHPQPLSDLPDTFRESMRVGVGEDARPPAGLSADKAGEAGRSDEVTIDLAGNILLNIGRYPEYQYGDKLKISGKIEEPFVTEEFSYKDYLSRFDIYAVMRFPQIEKIAEDQGHPVKAALLKVKHKFQLVLSRVLPEPYNALALGLILGLKRALPEDLKQALIIAGVSHIIVISGYNMSIITRVILKTRSWWGRRVAFWLSLVTVLAFVVLTGADASVVRAAVMAMLMVLALNLGRLYISLNALVFVATVMILQNPKILAFDLGFQLSFLATAGLIYLAPIFEKWFVKIPNILELRTNLASTLAAQVFTLPFLIFYFDRLSLVSPLVNVLILWAIPYAMFFAFWTGVAGMLYLPLAQILGAILWAILKFQIEVVEWFASLPLASVAVGIAWHGIVIYYLLLSLFLRKYRGKHWFYPIIHEEAKV